MAKTLAIIVGIILVVVGLLGFVANPLVGPGALFETNTMHDLVHLVLGAALLFVGLMAASQSALWLKIIGAVYLLVAVLGFIMPSPLLGLIATNAADHWLHLLVGAILLAGGFMANKGGSMGSMSQSMGTPNPPMGGGMGPRAM
jgi:hypothetical protein